MTKHLFKKETVLWKLLELTIHVCVVSTSTLIGFAPADSAWKNYFFAYVTSRKRSTDQQKQLQNDAFYVQKLAWSSNKGKSTQKVICALFAWKPSYIFQISLSLDTSLILILPTLLLPSMYSNCHPVNYKFEKKCLGHTDAVIHLNITECPLICFTVHGLSHFLVPGFKQTTTM